VDWAIVVSVAAGLLVVAAAAMLAVWSTRSVTDGRGDDGRGAIATGVTEAELGRRSVDSLQVGVLVLDGGDTPVLVNPSARAMGLLRAGPRPGSVSAHPVVRTLAGQVRRTGVRREVELDLPRGAAEPLGVQLRAALLGGDHVAVEASDVTEAHRVTRVRRDFVANVGHELKTPIGALQLLSEALVDATDPGGDTTAARRFAERIQHESTRLGRLVSELLELSRVQGAEPLPERTPVPVDWLVAEVLDRTRTGAAAKRIEVTVTGPRGLTVYGSDRQLATAVANLVENAVAYSPEGSRVVVSRRGDGDRVDISVADQGIGIPPEELDRVFERFYRSDRARSRATGGTGLGLAIVKHIATNHGGRVDVTSAPGVGSTFTLRLPARPLATGLDLADQDPEPATGERAPAGNGRRGGE
jgi:two-component system sensor histidine kinase SenX3